MTTTDTRQAEAVALHDLHRDGIVVLPGAGSAAPIAAVSR